MQTSTTIVGVVQTNTLHETTVTTQRATATTDAPGTTTTVVSVVDLRRRQQTGRPSNIPAYASACGAVAEYSSACSCIGVTATTIVLDPQTVTSYYSYTTSLLSTVTSTTATTNKIVTDITSTVTTTDSTQTNFVPTSTATVVTTLPLRQSMAIKLIKVTDGQSLGYLQPGGSPRNPLYASVGPLPYRFFFADDGTLNSASGKVGLEYYSDFHPGALSETVNNFRIMYPTLNPDRTITGWGLIGGIAATASFTTWFTPGTSDRYTAFVNSNVPISAPQGVGWFQVTYVAEPFLG